MSTSQAKSLIADYGAIAQLVEHLHGMQGVRSSSLLGSISSKPVPAMGLERSVRVAFFLGLAEVLIKVPKKFPKIWILLGPLLQLLRWLAWDGFPKP